MSRPKARVLKTIEREIPRGSALLLAVSGGKDSMSMLHACLALARKHRLRIEAAHVDHRFRKTSSDDARFVKKICEENGVPFHLKRCGKKPASENAESWGRKQRYGFFAQALKKRGLHYVVTAHTADDVAETLLMKLISNKELTSIERYDPKRSLLRPLLPVSREEIDRYAADHGVQFREDETNTDTGFLRNRVRHVLIPLLKDKFDPRIVEVLSKRALAIDADIRSLYAKSKSAEAKLGSAGFGSKPWLRLVRDEMKGMQDAVRWRFAEKLLKDKLGFNLGREKSQELVEFLNGNLAGIELPGGVRLRARDGGIGLIRR